MIEQALESGTLRVVFEWRTDRFKHRVERRMAGEWRPLLVSREGSPADDWPPSPVLQSLHIENLKSGPVALLVGKAGTSHWSASVESLAVGFQFDIACRIQQPPQWLGSVYQVADGSTEPLVQITSLPSEVICELQPTNVWRIQPVEVASAYPATIRWRYAVAFDICKSR